MKPSVDQRVGVALPGEVGVDVFTGSPGTLVRFGCHTYFWTWQPEFRFDASSGSEYFIMVSVPSGWVDAVSISFDVAPQGPSNDDFSSATVIGSYDFTDTVDADVRRSGSTIRFARIGVPNTRFGTATRRRPTPASISTPSVAR